MCSTLGDSKNCQLVISLLNPRDWVLRILTFISRLGIALVASCCRQVLILGIATYPFAN